ncbi:MAG: hypothetical protein JXR97_10135 [Planctomycetes bacterium]|nr:hypothetical protein [Planctomycetota bacterium]
MSVFEKAFASFINIFAIVFAFALGIMILALFFKLLNYAKTKLYGFTIHKTNGFLTGSSTVTLHLNNGKSFENVKLIGVADRLIKDAEMPYCLSNMLVFESADAQRYYIKADSIRIIQEQIQEESGQA